MLNLSKVACPCLHFIYDVFEANGAGLYELELYFDQATCLQNSAQKLTYHILPEAGAGRSFGIRLHYRDPIGSSDASLGYSSKGTPGGSNTTIAFDKMNANGTVVGSGGQFALAMHEVEYTHFEPYGEILPQTNVSSDDDPRFTNHEIDQESNTTYMKGRYQFPMYAKFNRPDPQRDWDWLRPHTLNLYEYVGNDPINKWDPDGFQENGRKSEWEKIGEQIKRSFENFKENPTPQVLGKEITEIYLVAAGGGEVVQKELEMKEESYTVDPNEPSSLPDVTKRKAAIRIFRAGQNRMDQTQVELKDAYNTAKSLQTPIVTLKEKAKEKLKEKLNETGKTQSAANVDPEKNGSASPRKMSLKESGELIDSWLQETEDYFYNHERTTKKRE